MNRVGFDLPSRTRSVGKGGQSIAQRLDSFGRLDTDRSSSAIVNTGFEFAYDGTSSPLSTAIRSAEAL